MANIEVQRRSMKDQQLPLDQDPADMTDICLTTGLVAALLSAAHLSSLSSTGRHSNAADQI